MMASDKCISWNEWNILTLLNQRTKVNTGVNSGTTHEDMFLDWYDCIVIDIWLFSKLFDKVIIKIPTLNLGGGPRVVVSTAAFHARVRGSVSAVWKKQKMFLPHPRVKVSIVGSLRDR